MKWVFLSLLVANIAYFTYQAQLKERDSARPVVTYPNVSPSDGVKLLSERNEGSAREQEAREVLQNPVQQPVAEKSLKETAQAEAVGGSEEQVVDDPPPALAAPAGNPAAAIGQDAEPDPDPEPAPEADPEPETPLPKQQVAASPDACWRLGAFEDLTIAQNIAERVNALGTEAQMRAIDAPTGDYDYRVVIPPLNSMPEAFRRLRELKSRNIDSYVMAQGENARGISLGLFSTEDAARRHQKNMSDLGYTAAIRPIARVSRAYWVYTRRGTFPAVILDAVQSSDPSVIAAESDCLN